MISINKALLLLILLSTIPSVKMDLKDLWQKFKKRFVHPPNCEPLTSQLISVVTLVCNNIADFDDTPSCIRCFNAASRSNGNQPSIAQLRDCAEIHLSGTDYDECISQLDDLVITPNATSCVTGYCDFVQCLRRHNADNLIDRCFQENVVDVGPFEDYVNLMKNVIACILRAARCESVNPVTGLQQSSVVTTITTDKWGNTKTNTVALYNSLQITPEGDLRIVRFPGNTAVQTYFCAIQAGLQQTPC